MRDDDKEEEEEEALLPPSSSLLSIYIKLRIISSLAMLGYSFARNSHHSSIELQKN